MQAIQASDGIEAERPLVDAVGRVRHSRIKPDELVPERDNTFWEFELRDIVVVYLLGLLYTVPAGFWTDGASIRYRAARVVLTRWGRRALVAALLHDYFYSDGRHLIPGGVGDRRLWCDRLFYDCLREMGVSRTRSWLAYQAVRRFGGGVWDKGEEAGFYLESVTKATLKAEGVVDYAAAA